MIRLLFLAANFTTATVFAANPSIEGSIKAADGKPLAGGEVRIEALEGKSHSLTARTDAKGRYSVTTVPSGKYKITVYVNNAAKSNAAVRLQNNSPLHVDFDLAANTRPQVKRYVWVKAETGTLFAGRWVPINQRNAPTSNPVVIVNGEAARKIFDHSGRGL